ncbi:hypothetical protein [Sneathiella aquimaris]|uniref:hypothetical protein n=1 Tax=Sneathiella aquimaris TaxID=2599305 RepID=UPI00146A633B|nr:hypothetical protein [Sneathiella aquimaris]
MFESAFYLLCATLASGLILHLGIARLTKGQRLYLSAFICLNGCLCLLLGIGFLGGMTLSAAGVFIMALFTESFFVVYALILIGVVNDSPTLAIVKALMKAGPMGLSKADFDTFIVAHPFFRSRVDALQATGDVVKKNEQLALTPRSRFIVAVISLYQRFLKIERETG